MKTSLTLVFVLIAMVGFSQNKSDTLVVDFSKYHYIKIGERVYKIESPTLIEVKEKVRGSILSLGLTIDTAYNFPTPYSQQYYRYDSLRQARSGNPYYHNSF